MFLYMVGSAVFVQFRHLKQAGEIQTNQTKSLIQPSLTYPPRCHVVQINRLRYSLLPAIGKTLTVELCVIFHVNTEIVNYFTNKRASVREILFSHARM